jgi:hypothetical protein
MDWRPAQDRQALRAARWLWAAAGVLVIVSSVAVGRLLLPHAIRAFVRATEAVIDGCVWFAMSLSAGMSLWSVVRRVMRTALMMMVSPQATVALAALVVVGVAAAYGLQRVLGSEEEST